MLDLGGKLVVGLEPEVYAKENVGARPAGLAEFDHVAGGNPARCAVEEIAIDDGAKFRRRQGVISPHQILDFKSAVFANGLQRGDHMGDADAVRDGNNSRS